MPSSLSGSRVTSSMGPEMRRPDDSVILTATGPSPSLWPESALRTSSSASSKTRRVRFNVASAIPIAANPTCRTQDASHTPCTNSNSHSNGTQVGSGSTLPTSNSSITSTPPPRAIDITACEIFEPYYPRWHAYPPIIPTKFDTRAPPPPLRGPSFNPTDQFLDQSRDFQSWIEQKNAERIQLRYTPLYESLLKEQRIQQHIADHGSTPRIRTDARMKLVQIRKVMTKEREKIAPAERQYIKDIEKGMAAFDSIDNHEQTASSQRRLSAAPPVETKSSLSKVERLLGSDGSCPSISSWNQRCQSIPDKSSYERMKSIEPDSGRSKIPPTLPLPPPEPDQKLSVMVETTTPWPDKPFKVLIPDWFPIAIAQRHIELQGRTVKECYVNLLNHISRLESAKSQIEYKKNHPSEGGIIVKENSWDKNWHEPNNGWRHEKQRRLGGYWKCNKGPRALPAEKNCTLCLETKTAPPVNPSPVAQLDDIMRHINEAMAVVAESDKAKLLKLRSSKKPSGLETPGLLVDETVKIWAHQDNPLTTIEPETIPISARQPWINYNPLRGIDDSEDAVAATKIHLQPGAVEQQEQKQPDDKDTNKSKDKCVSQAHHNA
ncbi:hypothetical protein F5B22DRAFT_261029 [Xylaria bambusicola]|uniref:uncharacterized protein n=1 Tax=Xylaria bambusicola TaxID=326684 RepID=UPI002008122F|nr:uncharacterized protein F5B22DRAFT_261029 [Xylaria bambusicola]KAI0525932.1 hypothetical protein F5B22DRAFT_261029 [Xylaria bambusicola]